MGYRLKDRELQRRLDNLSEGDFSRQIEGNLQNIKGRGTTDADYRLFFGDLPGRYEIVNRFSMLLYEHEIEVFEEYDPNDWNNFPEVTPPEGVWMRVETDMGFGFKARFQFGNWLDNRNDIIGPKDGIDGTVIRFRPWEDPE